MNIDSIRKKIRNENFPTEGMVIISILGIAGIIMLYFSGIFGVKDLNMLYECISKKGMIVVIGMFFFLISLYCWSLFFINIFIPPKNKILYLNKIEDQKAYFLNKKGKQYIYNINNDILEINSYYNVLKTHSYIYKVIEKTNDTWKTKEKMSYWFNFYSPMGNYENILILPIAYVLLIICILSFIASSGYQKVYGIILGIIILFVIVYDLIYKIQLKRNGDMEDIESKLLSTFAILTKSISIFVVGIIVAILFVNVLKLSDNISKIILLPFLGCALCTFGLLIARVLKNDKLENIFYKGYIVIFLIYWFGFLIYWSIGIINKGEYITLLYSIPFWIFGVFILYKCIIKK